MSLPPKRDRPRTTGRRGDWDITSEAPPKKPKAKPKPRSALKSSKGLARTQGPERTGPPERRTEVNPVSAKREARRGDREAVRKSKCALAHLGPCDGPVDTHEIVRTSQMAEARYMNDVTIGLCRKHHRLDTYRLTGERIGIRIPVDIYRQDPERYVEEAALLRVLALAPMSPRCEPSWWSDDDRLAWETNAERRVFAIRG